MHVWYVRLLNIDYKSHVIVLPVPQKMDNRNNHLNTQVQCYEAHTASIKELRQERFEAEASLKSMKAKAAKLRRELKVAKDKILADGQVHEANAQKLRQVVAKNNILQSKLGSFESRSTSIRNLRQERLEADTRADAAESRAEQFRLQLKVVKTKLQKAQRRCCDS